MHVLRALHVNALDARGHIERSGSTHQNYVRPAARCSFGNGVAHLAGGAIGQIAHRIHVFPGRTGGDQHRLSGQVAHGVQRFVHGGDDRFLPASRPAPVMPQAR